MTLLRILCVVWMLHLGPLCTPAASAEKVEVWESWFLCVKATAEIKRTGTTVQGVLTVRQPFQDDWVYHFTGSVADDKVEAIHYSGHRFAGKLLNEGELSGVVTTRTGMTFTISARRRSAILCREKEDDILIAPGRDKCSESASSSGEGTLGQLTTGKN